MNLKTIRSSGGDVEYVILPIMVYRRLRFQIDQELKRWGDQAYQSFDPKDHVDNPVVLARTKAGLTQKQLAKMMAVSQAYVSQLERQENISPEIMQKVTSAIKKPPSLDRNAADEQ